MRSPLDTVAHRTKGLPACDPAQSFRFASRAMLRTSSFLQRPGTARMSITDISKCIPPGTPSDMPCDGFRHLTAFGGIGSERFRPFGRLGSERFRECPRQRSFRVRGAQSKGRRCTALYRLVVNFTAFRKRSRLKKNSL